jgi:hypothetical protein
VASSFAAWRRPTGAQSDCGSSAPPASAAGELSSEDRVVRGPSTPLNGAETRVGLSNTTLGELDRVTGADHETVVPRRFSDRRSSRTTAPYAVRDGRPVDLASSRPSGSALESCRC